MRGIRRARRPLLALIALLAALGIGYAVQGTGSGSGHHPSTAPSVGTAAPVAQLPPQVAATITLIRSGGPFPYPRNDGVVFHNDEHRLPSEPDGYYHEYTVPTPGAPDRGARRIITGRGGQFYYTGNHYETFVRVAVGQ